MSSCQSCLVNVCCPRSIVITEQVLCADTLLSELQPLNHSPILVLPKDREVASGIGSDTTNRGRIVSLAQRCARGLVRLQPTLAQTTIDIVCDNAAATSPTRQLWVTRACPTLCYIYKYGTTEKTRKSREPVLQCWCARKVCDAYVMMHSQRLIFSSRKTGITLADRGVYDEHGLEPISGIFSSPEKSPPKRGDAGNASESMDIQESTQSRELEKL